MGLWFRLSVIKRKRRERRRRPEKGTPMGLSRKKRRRRSRPEMEIPMDVVTEEILTRLPVTSVMRFKCVSKLWSSLMSSRYFNNRFMTAPISRPHRGIYMCLQDFSDYRNSVTLSLAPDTTSSFAVDHNQTVTQKGWYMHQNLGGFMCYVLLARPRFYNPATRKLVTLPSPIKFSNLIRESSPDKASNKVPKCYFGHDPVNDQYTVLFSIGVYVNSPLGFLTVRSEHQVFVIKPNKGGSWKKVAPPPGFRPHIPAEGGVCIDGVIYYLGWYGADFCMLVSFHVRSQDFKTIFLPRREPPVTHVEKLSLIEYGGKATIIDQTSLTDKGRLDLLAVEGSKWLRKTRHLKPSQLHLVDKNTIFHVKGTTQDGKVFFIPPDLLSPFHILSYDIQSNDMRKIDIKGVPDHWFSKDKSTVELVLADQIESLAYLET